ncbi:AAA family ATPase [Pseudidiomarina terrestris]|uniref:AAA family ATPase n=1 Tax=Pseudidiomarina terrestris TaxID=2820060 RepID=UPI00265195A9|nr:AAA family ATPase [Pseudidiomarina sp. 1ASP75-5]MDN7136381.1 AAA family ATPase [Pseudidiomarina sp. 1ASP75-5]
MISQRSLELRGIINQELEYQGGILSGGRKSKIHNNQPQWSIPDDDDPFAWTARGKMTLEHRAKLKSPTWFYPNFIMASNLIVIAAKPNSGKTTLAIHLAAEMVRKAKRVFYINADVGASGIEFYQEHADTYGYHLIAPDFVNGLTPTKILVHFESAVKSNQDLFGEVIILDTLKKFADMMNKADLKDKLDRFRKLTARGATVILLAHTNKNDNENGEQVYEGTGDLRSEVDELFYLESNKRDDGSLIVTTRIDKSRSKVKELSFLINSEREVTLSEDSQKLQEQLRIAKEIETDKEAIDCLTSLLSQGDSNQKDLIDGCFHNGIPVRTAKRVLNKYNDNQRELPTLWSITQGDRKTKIYRLVS